MHEKRGLFQNKRVSKFQPSSGSSRHLVLLAPSVNEVPPFFHHVHADASGYEDLFADMQRLRGSVYLQDGAIDAGQLSDRRHHVAGDELSWHLLVVDKGFRVCGCARYREHSNQTSFSNLGISTSALARCSNWGAKLQRSVQAEMSLSRTLELPYVELGGWALHEQVRKTSEALRMALATYSLAQALGGGVGISTVTRRHGSTSILRKIGGRPLLDGCSELPSYYDPKYSCEMEILRFHSWAPGPRYAPWIAGTKTELRSIPVFSKPAAEPVRPPWYRYNPAFAYSSSIEQPFIGVCG
jgi:hypothetical protein